MLLSPGTRWTPETTDGDGMARRIPLSDGERMKMRPGIVSFYRLGFNCPPTQMSFVPAARDVHDHPTAC